MLRKIGSVAAVSGVVAVAGLLGATPALADVETRGSCSAGSQWEADIERDFNVYGIDFEVTSTRADESWRLTVSQNGKRVYSNARTTFQDLDDRFADVDWEVLRPDRKGVADRFALAATNTVTGEVCRTTLRG